MTLSVWLDLAGPVVSSFLGGLAGAALAFTRFKRERSFDRRAEWYERAFRVLSKYMSLQREWRHALTQPRIDGEELQGIADALGAAAPDRVFLDESMLYASQEIRVAIEAASARMRDQGEPIPPNADSVAHTIRQIDAVLAACGRAGELIVADYRRHMGIETLKPAKR